MQPGSLIDTTGGTGNTSTSISLSIDTRATATSNPGTLSLAQLKTGAGGDVTVAGNINNAGGTAAAARTCRSPPAA